MISVTPLQQIMSTQQQDQQLTQKFLFTITLLQIKSNNKLKTNTSKAILIKLGSKTVKFTQMNTPLDLQVDVLYSKTLKRYCPIKGIIKIYDISEDGAEVIACVGGFQTEQFLNQGKSSVVMEKELGASKLKMEIVFAKKAEKSMSERTSLIPQQNSSKEISNSRQKYLLAKKSPNQKPVLPPSVPSSLRNSGISSPTAAEPRRNSQISSQYLMKGVEIPYKNTSTNINKSIQKINQALNFKRFEQNSISAKANEILGRADLDLLKQQLSDQKRKTSMIEDRLSKANSKLNSYRAFLTALQNDTRTNFDIFTRLLNELDLKEGIQIELNEANKSITLKYKEMQVEKTLKQLIQIATKRVKQYVPFVDLQGESAQRGSAQAEQLRKEVSILKKLTIEKDKKIFSLQKSQQGMEQTIQHLKQTNKHLSQENSYLRQKNDQIQLTLYHKQNSLQNLRKQADKFLQQNTELQNRLYNCGLQNEQLRQQVDNLNETIQQYQQRYGQLKNVKNRAIEMQIKECIRWIDQQNRDLQMSEMDETLQSSEQKDERDDSLSSVIRNLEIEKVPIQQMSIIRDELMRILRKIDNLMTK